MKGKTATCTALVAWALLFLLTGLIAVDADLASGCDAEWEACAADPQCVECNFTSLCDYFTSYEATCAGVEAVCCAFDAIEACRNNEAYLIYGECFWGGFVGCDYDAMTISDDCSGGIQADSGSPGIAPAPAHGLAAAVVTGVAVAASGFMS